MKVCFVAWYLVKMDSSIFASLYVCPCVKWHFKDSFGSGISQDTYFCFCAWISEGTASWLTWWESVKILYIWEICLIYFIFIDCTYSTQVKHLTSVKLCYMVTFSFWLNKLTCWFEGKLTLWNKLGQNHTFLSSIPYSEAYVNQTYQRNSPVHMSCKQKQKPHQ